MGCRQGEGIQREGGAAENDSEKWRNGLLKEIQCSLVRYDTAGRLKAEKGRQKGCTSAFCTFSSNVLFCLYLFCCFSGQLQSFAKDCHFQSKPKSQGTVVVHLIYGYFFLFCFSEISCWGNKTPCNFQQWKVNKFFCLKKPQNLIFIFTYLIFALACTFLLSSSHMLLFVVKDFFPSFFLFF